MKLPSTVHGMPRTMDAPASIACMSRKGVNRNGIAERVSIAKPFQSRSAPVSRTKGGNMPRYLVERDFANEFHLPITPEGVAAVREIIARNGDCAVTWVSAYVSDDEARPSAPTMGPLPKRSAGPRNRTISRSARSPR
jgi:hypothetical protein